MSRRADYREAGKHVQPGAPRRCSARPTTTRPGATAICCSCTRRDRPERQRIRGDRGGLPKWLKAGIERLSGLAMDDVRVHRNSSEPAKLGALAYTKGSDIHLGPGQERHLPHEAWHVVQQKQGRVQATAQMKGVAISEDAGLEAGSGRDGRSRIGTASGPDARCLGKEMPLRIEKNVPLSNSSGSKESPSTLPETSGPMATSFTIFIIGHGAAVNLGNIGLGVAP